eukprot:1144904-Pelagomonas_calceolata.AAC.3
MLAKLALNGRYKAVKKEHLGCKRAAQAHITRARKHRQDWMPSFNQLASGHLGQHLIATPVRQRPLCFSTRGTDSLSFHVSCSHSFPRLRRCAAPDLHAIKTSAEGIVDFSRPDLESLSAGLPQGWQAMWDKKTGDIYYGNPTTKQGTFKYNLDGGGVVLTL